MQGRGDPASGALATARAGGGCVPRLALWALLVLSAPAAGAGEDVLPPYLLALTGAEVPRLLGSPIACLRAFAGAPDPLDERAVPLQVDERFPAGDALAWAFAGGTEPRHDPEPRFDGDDLLLLDLREAGPCGADSRDGLTIESPGFGCLTVRCAAAAAPPPRVHVTAGGNGVAGTSYEVGFAPTGRAWLNALKLGEAARAPNLLDRSKARLRLELPLGLVVERDEDDLRAEVTGEHAGPLRVVREMAVRGRVTLGMYSAPIRDRFVFYADGFTIPTSVAISRTAAVVIRSITLRLSMDLRPPAPAEFRSAPDVPAALPVSGAGGWHGTGARLDWYLLRSGATGLVGWLETDAAYADRVTLYYRDDAAHRDPPEEVAGELGDHGFLFTHAGPLTAGGFRITTQAWVVRGADLDDPARVRARFHDRPAYRVH